MKSRWSLVVVLLMGSMLAGCIGGDDTPLTTDADEDEPLEGTGAIEGRIYTTDLLEIKGARVSLTDGEDLVKETTTQSDGRYRIQNVEPGDYRLQVTAPCCRENVRPVTMVAGETITMDLQLEPFTASDLQAPYVEEYDWTGFLSCGVTAGAPGVIGVSGELCSDLDSSSDVTHGFEIQEGLKTVVAAVVWQATGGVLGESLGIGLHHPTCSDGICDVDDPDDTYGYTGGTSPLILRVDDPGGAHAFEDIEGSRDVRFMVLPEFGIDLYYQQEFTVYYTLHYHEPAPEGFDPTPDL